MEVYTVADISFKVVRSKKRRRTIAIHLSPKKGIEIKVPYATKLERIIALVEERLEWINKRLALLPKLESKTVPWYERETLWYLGQEYKLMMETFPFAKKRGECELFNNALKVTLTQNMSASEHKNLLIKTLETWYRTQAKIYLETRTEYFSKLMALRPKSIMIKSQKSRWGSCDSQNNIRYNWKIIMASPELIDYLVVHELAHIKVKNHSAKFWNVVALILPDHQTRRKKLRELSRALTEV